MKMRSILLLLPLAVCFSMCRNVKKSSEPRDVVVDTTMIKMLIPGDGSGVWSGGDGAISIPIKKDKSLWLFGDSFMGRIVDGKRDREKFRMVFDNLIMEQAWNDVKATIPYFIWVPYEMVLNEAPQQGIL